ncbi:MAG: FAD-dependent oxidoreductase [[Clostridium] scindens]
MKDVFDILIIGAGPAGLSAAIEAAKYGAEVLVVDENSKPGGQTCLSRYISFSAPDDTKQGSEV